MMKMRPVILCGNSVFMYGLALMLTSQGDFPVLRAADLEELRQILPPASPATILVDIAAGRQWFADLIGKYPDTTIIAVSPENSTAAVYSPQRVSTVADLKTMLMKYPQPAGSGLGQWGQNREQGGKHLT